MLEHIIGERYSLNNMKKILFFLIIFLLLIISNIFASCGSELWLGSNHDILIESLPLEANPGEEFNFTIKIYSHQEFYNSPSFPGFRLNIDYGDGNSKTIRLNVAQGLNQVFLSECSTANTDQPGSMVSFDCTFNETYSYSSYGDKIIAVTMYDQLGNNTYCQEAIINIPTPCGNGILETDEECDTGLSVTKRCEDYGFTYGEVLCGSDCKLDSSGCTNEKPKDNTTPGLDESVDTTEPKPGRIKNPLIWENVIEFGKYLITYIFRIGSGLAVAMILVGAIMLATSSGDLIRIGKGKQILIWAVIGFVVTMIVNGIIALIKTIMGVK